MAEIKSESIVVPLIYIDEDHLLIDIDAVRADFEEALETLQGEEGIDQFNFETLDDE